MSDIRIGEVLVHDINDNNLYDTGDRVSGPTGSPISPKEQSLRLGKILGELQASSWSGILLSEAATGLEAFKRAEQESKNGNPEETRQAISEARDAWKNLPVPFNQSRADLLMQQALSLRIPNAFQEAGQTAQYGGDITEVRDLLEGGGGAVNELNIVYGGWVTFDRHAADGILKTAYTNGIPPLYGKADLFAQAGQIEATHFELTRIQTFVQEANQFYNLGVTYDAARADQIMVDAYIKGIPLLYSRADQQAQRGQARRVRQILSSIQNHIQDANQNHNLGFYYNQPLADAILGKALFFGVKDNFNLAL